MTAAGAIRMTFKLAAVLFLVAAGIGWWKLFGRGFTMGGVFLPAFNTGMGLFLWFFALRANCCSENCCSEDSGKANSGADT